MMKDEWRMMKGEGLMMKDGDFKLLKGFGYGRTVCTVSCGGGTQTKTRTDGEIFTQGCNFDSCPSSGN